MFTFVAHAVHNTRLFADWEEASALWLRIVLRGPGLRGLVLMPNHLHLDSTSGDPKPLDLALRAFALWRNHHRGEAGAVWAARPAPEALSGPKHIRRNLRYLHLNPCRARLVACPAAWPFSTHRDCLGLAAAPARPRVSDPFAFHAYVSGDPSCAVEGTPYPSARLAEDRIPLGRIAAAVSEYLRRPLSEVYAPGKARRTFLAAARSLTDWSGAAIADHAGCSRALVSRTRPLETRAASAIARMAADDRFWGLRDQDPRLLWRR